MNHNYLIHYGIPRRSGRYPWGSGERPYQSGGSPPKTSKDMKRIGKKLNDRINERLAGRVSNKIDASPEAKRSGEVYDKTYKWFRKNKPEQLDKMIKQAGSRYDLDDVKEFKEIYDKFDSDSKNVAYDKETGFIKINHVESRQDRLKYCNPNYTDSDKVTPYNMNCGNTVIANELRRRGLDVEARGNNIGLTVNGMTNVFKGANSKAYKRDLRFSAPGLGLKTIGLVLMGKQDSSEVMEAIKKRGEKIQNKISKQLLKDFPDNSRGAIMFTAMSGSHWFSFDIKNGKVLYSNPQNPNENILDIFGLYQDNGYSNPSTAIRLDGLATTDLVKSMVKNRGDRIADIHGMDWDPLSYDKDLNNKNVRKYIDESQGNKWDGSWTSYDPVTKKYTK